MHPSPHSTDSARGRGQFGETELLERIFTADSGVCLEVGAFDGETGSATLAFERRGWTAILVEPLPEMAVPIRARRKGPLFTVAAGATAGFITFHRTTLDLAVSSAVLSSREEDLRLAPDEHTETLRVEQRTLDSILAEANVARVDFATIDVEGAELDVLRGWDLDRWRPRVLIIEDNSRGLDRSVPDHLRRLGYHCFQRTGVNDWYARETDRALVTPTARLRVFAYRRFRVLRHLAKTCAPDRAKTWLRRRGWAGES